MSSSEVVVITGASAGVGRAIALEFARHGARIALLARGLERLEAARQEIRNLGGTAIAIPTDVAFPEQIAAAAARVEVELGPIDIWVNNAMTTVFGPLTAITPEEYRRVTDVTYHGVVWGTMAALEYMLPRNRGIIVQVGSALSYRAIPLQSAYCGAKHAIRAFTDSLRSELLYEGNDIHLTMVHLPGVNTPQFDWCRSYMPNRAQPVPPIYQPEVAARAVYYAAHNRRREVYVGWVTVKTIIGSKVVPGYLDRYLARKAISGQQTNEPEQDERPSNLFEPVPGPYSAHGRFDARATQGSRLTDLMVHMGAAGVRVALLAGSLSLIILITLAITLWAD